MLSSDLANIFADTSLTVTAVYGSPAQNKRGFFATEDVPEDDGNGGVVLVARRVLTVQDTAFTGLAKNTAIVIDGTTYRIHDLRSGGRGKTKIVVA